MVEKTVFAGRSGLPSCMKCRYYDTVTDMMRGQSVNICRLNPPEVFAMPGMEAPGKIAWIQGQFWPQVAASDWCGQFSPAMDS